ncbi:hypothetical protein EDEG_03681 [Edhazardia aedis USNM 41457]|uniref:Transmembrane protein n=1 Tax=Edhazardia aedis (strain USNM 41457) TaxID=1003232 RepID=J9DGV4_EDHAE|nr:hypothetical protein EDEG_03681 [Edhazardia aedis USNM 41457]|eukprot:EJW01835.1 hypothetical protein EDEG_03681 [Edhazardia aedis USNM 41457]
MKTINLTYKNYKYLHFLCILIFQYSNLLFLTRKIILNWYFVYILFFKASLNESKYIFFRNKEINMVIKILIILKINLNTKNLSLRLRSAMLLLFTLYDISIIQKSHRITF